MIATIQSNLLIFACYNLAHLYYTVALQWSNHELNVFMLEGCQKLRQIKGCDHKVSNQTCNKQCIVFYLE